ncbi:hypothetical protein ACIF6L_34800 [Kitasatospora sp. NPDC086009]|uniref:hypothetical protein n=1 Tax=unclassified Kitasatospora TaxID=2633591 RepID=UPI0037C95222
MSSAPVEDVPIEATSRTIRCARAARAWPTTPNIGLLIEQLRHQKPSSAAAAR